MAQEKDWADKMVDKIGEWLDSLSDKNETQNLGEWTRSTQKKRQGKEETAGT